MLALLAIPVELRLYTLDGGEGRIADSAVFSDVQDAPQGAVRLADPSFLIRHGKDWMVWDTGLPDTLVGHPQIAPGTRLTKRRTESAQLRALSLSPKDVRYVALSHCHFDHAGTLSLFSSADWLVERSELAYMRQRPAPFSVVPSLLVRKGRGLTKAFSGDEDVFGDGTVRILHTPGHTPGHCCLLLKLRRTGPVILSGDLFHSHAAYDREWVPTINANRADTLASMARVKGLAKNLGARLVIQHDPKDVAALPKAPGYLD